MRMFTNATVDSMKQQSPGMAFAEELLNTKPDMTQGPPPAPVGHEIMMLHIALVLCNLHKVQEIVQI